MVADKSVDNVLDEIKQSLDEASTEDGTATEEAVELTNPETDNAEELVDIEAFAETGETKPAEKTEAAAPAAPTEDATDDDAGDIDDIDIDALMAEAEGDAEVAAATADAEEMIAQDETDVAQVSINADESTGDDDIDAIMAAAADVGEEIPVVDEAAAVEESAPVAEAAAPVDAAPAREPVHLAAIPSAKGLQVGFPMEVLAEALRPLVQEWVQDNLSEITERLVREEITKLMQSNQDEAA